MNERKRRKIIVKTFALLFCWWRFSFLPIFFILSLILLDSHILCTLCTSFVQNFTSKFFFYFEKSVFQFNVSKATCNTKWISLKEQQQQQYRQRQTKITAENFTTFMFLFLGLVWWCSPASCSVYLVMLTYIVHKKNKR